MNKELVKLTLSQWKDDVHKSDLPVIEYLLELVNQPQPTSKEVEEDFKWLMEFGEQVRMGIPDDVYFDLVHRIATIKQALNHNVSDERTFTNDELYIISGLLEQAKMAQDLDFMSNSTKDRNIKLIARYQEYITKKRNNHQPNLDTLKQEIIDEILKIEDVESFTRFDGGSIYVDGNTFCYRTPKGIMMDYDNLSPKLYTLLGTYFKLLEEGK